MSRWIIALLLCSAFGRLDATAATIAVTPPSQLVSNGTSAVVDLTVSDLAGGIVGDFDVDVLFDLSALAFDTFTIGNKLGDVGIDALDFSLGTGGPFGPSFVNLSVVSLLSGASLALLQTGPSFSLATLHFTVTSLSPGSSTTIGVAVVNALGDGNGDPIPVNATPSALLTARQPSSVVPEPATGVLCLTGLAAWKAARRTRR